MNKVKLSSLLFSLLLGLLAALPLLVSSAALLSFILIIPFFYQLFRLEGIRARGYYLHSLFFFQGYLMAAFSFFIAMYPLDFAGLTPLAALSVILAATVLLPLFQGCFLAFGGVAFALFKRKNLIRRPFLPSFTAAAIFTLLFFCQNFTWAGVPWASPAVGLTALPSLIGSASLFGSGFLIFLIFFINALCAEGLLALRSCRKRASLLALGLAVGLFSVNLLYGLVWINQAQKGEEETLTVALIQSCAPVKEELTVAEEIAIGAALAAEAAKEAHVDVMIWPESIVHHALERDKESRAIFSKVAMETGAIQLVGSFSDQVNEDNIVHFYNSIFVFYPDGSMGEERYNKRRPVPFGEYLPMARLFGTLIPALADISMLSRDTQPGEGSQLFSFSFGRVGGLLCFDSIYPALARESAKDGAALLVLPTNDSWFDGSAGKDIHFAHAVLRAVENRRTVVRVGNTGISGVILPSGRVSEILERDESAVLVSTVTLCEETSVYTRIGDTFQILLAAYLILYPLTVFSVRKTRKEHTDA